MISFLCPHCTARLNVRVDLAGVAGPCPVCAEMIRAPRAKAQSMISRQVSVTTSQITLPGFDQGWTGNRSTSDRLVSLPGDKSGMLVNDGDGFSAVKKIEAPSAEGMDDSWKQKVERDRKQWRMRHRRDRWIETLLESPGARKFQRIGVIALTVILGITMLGLYLNHRSGGALLKRLFG